MEVAKSVHHKLQTPCTWSSLTFTSFKAYRVPTELGDPEDFSSWPGGFENVV